MRPRTLLLSLSLAAALCGGVAAQQPAAVDNLVLAVVNGESINRGKLVERLMANRGAEALDKIINRELVVQAASRHKLAVTDKEVEEKLAEVRGKFKNDEAYRDFLTRNRFTEEQLRREIESTLLVQRVVLKETPISDEDLTRYDVRLIVAPDRATAEKWIEELNQGGNFIKIAQERSEEQSLRAAGGRMRPFLRIEMLDVAGAVDEQKLKPSQYTKTPVKLDEKRWAIIKLEGFVPVTDSSALEQDRLRAAMTTYRVDQWLAEARKKAEIQKKPLSEPVVAMINGKPVSRNDLVSRLLAAHGEETLEQIVNRTILLQAAKRLNVSVTDKEAAESLTELKKQFKAPEAYETFLTRSNLTERQLQEQLGYSVLLERVALKDSPIKDEDLQRYDVRMIVCPTRAVAVDWIADLNKGADFEKMARQRSQDQQGRSAGGRMAPFLRVEMLDVWRGIDEQKLKPGQHTKTPVLLADGSNVIIKLESILPVSAANKEERETLHRTVARYRTGRWLDDARKQSQVAYPTPVSTVVNVANTK